VRPHIEDLLRLYPHFRIGVFSSATVRTVNTALDTLYAALQRSAAQRGIGEHEQHAHQAQAQLAAGACTGLSAVSGLQQRGMSKAVLTSPVPHLPGTATSQPQNLNLMSCVLPTTPPVPADGLLLPKKYELFNLIYYRDHCQPDPYVSWFG
jgi:hypothetical protein